MKFKVAIALCFVGTIFLISCQKKKQTVSFEVVLQQSLEYIFSYPNRAEEYYKTPLKIIRPKRYPINQNIIFNKRKCLLLPVGTDPHELMKGMDIFKPVPIVEISSYRIIKDNLTISILLRATGNIIDLTLKGNDDAGYKVVNVSEGQI
jgi:hypothetical protein